MFVFVCILPHVSLFATRVCMCVSKLDKGEGHCVPAASDLVEIPTAGNFYTAIIIMCVLLPLTNLSACCTRSSLFFIELHFAL